MDTYPTEKMARMTVANAKPAGVPMPLPYPTDSGVLKSIAEIGAAPVTVRKRTPARPTAPPCNFCTSSRSETSTLSICDHPLMARGFHAFHLSLLRALTGMGICPG